MRGGPIPRIPHRMEGGIIEVGLTEREVRAVGKTLKKEDTAC